MRTFALCLCLATPALAGVDTTIDAHILPAFDTFAEQAQTLADSAARGCRADSLRPAYDAAFDAWMGIAHLGFGPLEKDGRGQAIAFWPDTRDMVGKTVSRLVTEQDGATATSETFAQVSVAGRGLFALERMLFDPALSAYEPADYGCTLVLALSRDMARSGQDLRVDWVDFGKVMRTAGQPGNTTYLDAREAAQALYTALLTGLEFTRDQRLGRPLGTFDKPRPTRAEAWRSVRPLRNVTLSLIALLDLARKLSDTPIPRTEAAFADALAKAAALDDPALAGVEDPATRLKIEILQQAVGFAHDAVAGEIGAALGLSAGFNSQDGD